MNSKYDFILFENYHQAQHHKFDMVLIARMLQSQGLYVAILDVYGEDKGDYIEGIEVVHLPFRESIPNDKWQLAPKNKLHSLACKLRFLWQQHHYIKQVVGFIEPMAAQFYCGSYHVLMSPLLMNMRKPTYFWGLRSSRMTSFCRKFKNDPIEAINALRIKRAFFRNDNCQLFVSNEIIREEFHNLGIAENRLVIREERCVETISDSKMENMDANPSFLVIGQLREQKNIPLTIEAFKRANIPSSQLYLIGRSQGKYEQRISDAIHSDEHIIRKNEFLEYTDFHNYFSKSHFVLFADDKGESCITNGTMMEALINHRPVICPDYNPYTYYIEKYGIGLVYQPKNVASYAAVLQKASELGTEYFLPNIERFLETITFKRVSEQFVNDLKLKK